MGVPGTVSVKIHWVVCQLSPNILHHSTQILKIKLSKTIVEKGVGKWGVSWVVATGRLHLIKSGRVEKGCGQ